MATVTFDTLRTSRNLQAAGIAEALTDTVATKADIAALEASTKADIAEIKSSIAVLEASTKAMIESLKSEMNRALFVQGAAVVALVFGLLKLT